MKKFMIALVLIILIGPVLFGGHNTKEGDNKSRSQDDPIIVMDL